MSKPKAFFFPGKIGDTLLQWPVADLWLKENDATAEVWLDEGTCKPLVPLFEAQPRVSAVQLKGPSKDYSCGGQPWHGDFGSDLHEQYEIVPLGFRQFPQRQITLQTALDCPLKVNTQQLATEVAFDVGPIEKKNACIIHGTFQTHLSGTPHFWRFLYDIRKDLEERFDEIVFVGVADERKRASELYSGGPWTTFDDGGSFLDLARRVAGARLVLGSGSSGVALASVLKVPTVRIHDPIGNAPKAIWAGLGERQWNETEICLRKEWPNIVKVLNGA